MTEYEEGLWPDGTPWKKIKPVVHAPPRPKEPKELSIEQLRKMVAIAEGQPATPVPALPKIGKEAIALALLTEHSDWTDAEIARSVPCHRSSLYRFRKYMAARELMEKERMNRPRGSKSKDGDLEAWK